VAINNHQPMVIIQRIPMANQRLQAASLGYQFCPLQTQARWIQQVRNVWGNPVALASASGKTHQGEGNFTPEV